jgi:fructokinase
LANDANCFALSEATDGAGAAMETVFGVILGTGVGGGLAFRRQILVGANAIAGEWGHNPLPWPAPDEIPGPPCYCGRSGCLESFLSGPALTADHYRYCGRNLDAAGIADAAERGEPASRATLERYMHRLARGLASVINLFDPTVIVLGGGLSRISALYEQIPRMWGQYIFSDQVVTRLLPPVHGDLSGVRGAAWLWPPDEAR